MSEKETQTTRQIHSLSDEECSRWIAEKLEPTESLPIAAYPHISTSGCKIEYGEWLSPLRTRKIDARGWQYRDFVNDAQMTVMLLKRMIAEESSFIIGLQGVAHRMSARFTSGMNGAEYGELLGRAVAEAFMLANGYKAC